MIGCQKGNLSICDLLINAGAQINAANSLGDTPMSLAQRKGFHDIVMKLAEKGGKLKLSRGDLSKSTKFIQFASFK